MNYVEPASRYDMMVDQFAFLLAHKEGGHVCPPICPECIRLDGIYAWCALPFHERTYEIHHPPKLQIKAAA